MPNTKPNSTSAAETSGLLKRRDLIICENDLCSDLSRIIDFDSHTLYFPAKDELVSARFLESEKKLLLPLRQTNLEGTASLLLAVLMLENAHVHGIPLEKLENIASLCLEKILLAKSSRLDPATDFYHRHSFIDMLKTQSAKVKRFLASNTTLDEYETSLAVFYINFPVLSHLGHKSGISESERVFTLLARCLKSFFPAGAFYHRSGPHTIQVAVPGANNAACRQIATQICSRFQNAVLSDRYLAASAAEMYGGYAVYPGDWHPDDLCGDEDIAALLLDKSREASKRQKNLHGIKILGYHEILQRGGRITQMLQHSELLINLGEKDGASQGMSFLVERDGQDCGEISLYEVHEKSSKAQILFLDSPERFLQPGDCLRFSGFNAAVSAGQNNGLMTYRQLHSVITQRNDAVFSLALLHAEGAAKVSERSDHKSVYDIILDTGLLPEDALFASFSVESLFIYLPGQTVEECRSFYEKLVQALSSREGILVSVGIFIFPFMDFTREDCGDCCKKALNYARLLDSPHIGIFDSVAINISADRLFSNGDLALAEAEYRLSIKADPQNATALNSLGVCLASTGRYAEATRFFEDTIAVTPKDSSLYYNLANTYSSLGDLPNARKNLKLCLKYDKNNIYALLKLGSLAEETGDKKQAAKYYHMAQAANPEMGLPYRYLAQIEDDPRESRRLLRQALRFDENDPLCLEMLANNYLDSGEDASLAESLLRKSLAIHPDNDSAKRLLSAVLVKQGKNAETDDFEMNGSTYVL